MLKSGIGTEEADIFEDASAKSTLEDTDETLGSVNACVDMSAMRVKAYDHGPIDCDVYQAY